MLTKYSIAICLFVFFFIVLSIACINFQEKDETNKDKQSNVYRNTQWSIKLIIKRKKKKYSSDIERGKKRERNEGHTIDFHDTKYNEIQEK